MQEVFENTQILPITYRPFKVLMSTKGYNEREHGMNSIIYQNKERIDILSDFYFFDNPEEIEDFLLANDYLIDILLDAILYINKDFGDVTKQLELYSDLDEETPTLFIILKSPYSTEENMHRQDQLIERWFINIPIKARRKLSIETALT